MLLSAASRTTCKLPLSSTRDSAGFSGCGKFALKDRMYVVSATSSFSNTSVLLSNRLRKAVVSLGISETNQRESFPRRERTYGTANTARIVVRRFARSSFSSASALFPSSHNFKSLANMRISCSVGAVVGAPYRKSFFHGRNAISSPSQTSLYQCVRKAIKLRKHRARKRILGRKMMPEHNATRTIRRVWAVDVAGRMVEGRSRARWSGA